MRIGFDAKRAFHNYSGLGNYSRNVIHQLGSLYPDNEYYLYNPKPGKALRGFPPPGTIVHEPEGFINRKFASLWRGWKLSSVLERDRIDIYHGLSNELPFGINAFSGRKVVTIHDLIFLKYPNLYKPADRAIYTAKFRYSAKLADSIIAISEQTKRDIVEYFNTDPTKIEVIYQDCAPVFYQQDLSMAAKLEIERKYDLPDEYILYVGTIEERKNLLSILKAMDAYQITLPLVVVGKPTFYKKEVIDFIVKKRMNHISFIDYAQQEDLPEIYKKANVFLYPSSYEGFGIPVLEALNSGTPVITSRGSCLQETGGDAALYADPLNIQELGAGIKQVLEDAALRSSMIEKGKKHALNFRPEITTRKLFKLYEKLMEK